MSGFAMSFSFSAQSGSGMKFYGIPATSGAQVSMMACALVCVNIGDPNVGGFAWDNTLVRT